MKALAISPPPLKRSSNSIDYVCQDCHVLVHAFGIAQAPDPPLCCGCGWLHDWEPNLIQRAIMRARWAGYSYDR